jgi:hypothetical protein
MKIAIAVRSFPAWSQRKWQMLAAHLSPHPQK